MYESKMSRTVQAAFKEKLPHEACTKILDKVAYIKKVYEFAPYNLSAHWGPMIAAYEAMLRAKRADGPMPALIGELNAIYEDIVNNYDVILETEIREVLVAKLRQHPDRPNRIQYENGDLPEIIHMGGPEGVT